MQRSPIEQLPDLVAGPHKVSVSIKREDLIGGPAQGNKRRKLSRWIQLAKSRGQHTLVTFGGAFSNHLYATAWVAAQQGLQAIGYVRGEEDPANPTLKACRDWGMELRYVTRQDYRQLKSKRNHEDHPKALVIPEGGAGLPGQQGMEQLAAEIMQQDNSFSHWLCPLGTGTTALGLSKALRRWSANTTIMGFDVLRRDAPAALVAAGIVVQQSHFGGFAKTTPELINFMRTFHERSGIYLDPIYTGKMVLRTLQLIESGSFPKDSRLLIIHTGGQQGIHAYNYRFGPELPAPTSTEPDAVEMG